MSPRAKEIFAEAIGLPPGKRDGYLAAACGGDDALRAEVASLMSAHDGAGEFLAFPTFDWDASPGLPGSRDVPGAKRAPAVEGRTVLDPVSGHAQGAGPRPIDADRDAEAPGGRVGRYRLVEPIGAGGFGTVYLAEQEEPVRRRVALKVIKLGMDTRQVVARFEAERQALAVMDHPNIARVYDGGATATGRPYFVMELVEGQPVIGFCDEHHLTARQRIALFITICGAVQHAHQKGVIHRDLKPSNVLVALHDDGVAVAKVIDFGIAKAVQASPADGAALTAARQMIGTPAYMSPEQADPSWGDVDTRSDVYSLGVMLYELLTGSTPVEPGRLARASYAELQRLIVEEDPPPPSTRLAGRAGALPSLAATRGTDARRLTRTVRGELDWIVMKCLEKDRARRYGGAGELAADLRRFLDHEPVQAGPPTTSYRLRKFVRRHRLPLGAVAAVVLSLAGGAVAATYGLFRARDAAEQASKDRNAAVLAAQNEARQARAATFARDEAREVTNFILDALLSGGPEAGPGRTTTIREAIDGAARRIDAGDLDARPEVAARVRTVLANLYVQAGLYEAAERHARAALALRTERLGAQALDTSESQANLAAVLVAAGRYDEARDHLAPALAALRLAVSRHPAGPAARLTSDQNVELGGLAQGLMTRAHLCAAQGRPAEARAAREEALAIRASLFGPRSRMVADSHTGLADSLMRLGDLDGAEAHYRSALDALDGRGGDDAALGRAANGMALLLLERNRHAEAIPLLRRSLDASVAVYGERHPAVATVQFNLALALTAGGEHAQARQLVDAAIKTRRELRLDRDPETVKLLAQAGTLAQFGGDGPAALRLYREAIALDAELFPGGRPETATLRSNVAAVLLEQKPSDLDAAEAELRKALEVRYEGADKAWLSHHVRSTLGYVLTLKRRFEEAEPLVVEGAAGMMAAAAPAPPPAELTGKALARVIYLYREWDKPERASFWNARAHEWLAAHGRGGGGGQR